MNTKKLFYALIATTTFIGSTAFANNYSMSLTVNGNPYKDGDKVEVFQNGGQTISWDSDAQVCFVSSKNASILVPKNPDGTSRMSPKKGGTSARFSKAGDASITIKCNNQYDLDKGAEEESSYTRTIQFVVKTPSTTPLVKAETTSQSQPQLKVEPKKEVVKQEVKPEVKPVVPQTVVVKEVAQDHSQVVNPKAQQEIVPPPQVGNTVQKTEKKGFLSWLRSFFFGNK